MFVCDNLAFRGDMIALRRKHTSGLNLRVELAGAVLRFQEHFGGLAGEVELLKERMLPDIQAKALIHTAFAEVLMPVRFLPEVSQASFDPQLQEFAPRNAWSLQGLHRRLNSDAHNHAAAGDPGIRKVLWHVCRD